MKLLNSLLVLVILGLSVSCEKSESAKSTEANLLSVTCSFGNGVIDEATKAVTIKAPEGTDITQIIPQFEISKNATIFPLSGVAVDFTNPVNYTITAEDNTTKNVYKVTVIKSIVKFKVYDCSNWSPTNFNVPVANATIKIYTKAEDVGTEKIYETLTTDQNAQATLYGLKTNDYYLTVSKDNKSNIYSGNVLKGTYNNQMEVDESFDPNARIGGYRIMDVNGDGHFDSHDKITYERISSQYDLLDKTSIYSMDLFIGN